MNWETKQDWWRAAGFAAIVVAALIFVAAIMCGDPVEAQGTADKAVLHYGYLWTDDGLWIAVDGGCCEAAKYANGFQRYGFLEDRTPARSQYRTILLFRARGRCDPPPITSIVDCYDPGLRVTGNLIFWTWQELIDFQAVRKGAQFIRYQDGKFFRIPRWVIDAVAKS